MSGDMAEAGSTPITPEEQLPDVAYAYDGTLEGLLSAVFEAYERREDPQDVTAQAALQPRLGQTVRFVETDVERAVRVQRGIKRVCGHAAYDAVMRASLSDEPDAAPSSTASCATPWRPSARTTARGAAGAARAAGPWPLRGPPIPSAARARREAAC